MLKRLRQRSSKAHADHRMRTSMIVSACVPNFTTDLHLTMEHSHNIITMELSSLSDHVAGIVLPGNLWAPNLWAPFIFDCLKVDANEVLLLRTAGSNGYLSPGRAGHM